MDQNRDVVQRYVDSVVEGGQRIKTDRDLAIRLVAGALPAQSKIGEIMTREVISCTPKDDIRLAERLMARNHKSRIMCVEDGRLVGVISLSDIAQKDGGRAGQTLAEVTTREAHA